MTLQLARRDPNGRADGTTPASGEIGELVQDITTSAPSLSSLTPANAASKLLQPGVYLVWGGADISASGTNMTQGIVSVGTTSATLNNNRGASTTIGTLSGTAADFQINTAPQLVVITTATTYYTVVRATFATGTATATGYISAVRIA